MAHDAAHARKLRTLQTAESLAMLDASLLADARVDGQDTDAEDPDAAPPLSMRIALRRGRLALLVGGVVAVVALATLALARGAELERFDRRERSASDLARLLDRYNAVSGNVASALGRPLELFLVLMAQVLVLWCMTDAVLAGGGETAAARAWHAKLAVMALGAVAGFLLLNGLNALNVQVRELPVTMVLSASDLRVPAARALGNASTLEKSFSERAPGNPSSNTILRNLILPRAATKLRCRNDSSGVQEDIVAFRVPQREWMKSLLPTALPVDPASVVRIDLKANTTANIANDFPMTAGAAADLLVLGVYTANAYAPFAAGTPFMSKNAPLKWYNISTRGYAPTARLSGLLPPAANATETQDREWFLARSTGYLRAVTNDEFQNATALRRWSMELTRVNLTPSVWMEAVTLESEMIPLNKAARVLDGAWYLEGAADNRGSSAAHRLFTADGRTHPGAVIHAFASCVSANGSSTLHSFVDIRNYSLDATVSSVLDCANTSRTEMLVFSSAKHLVADALDDFMTLNATEGPRRVVKNPRMIYSTTFARVRWNLRNLSEIYGAECRDDDGGGCMGLDAELTDSNQRLLVGASALPLNELSSIKSRNVTGSRAQQPLEIVYVRRPTQVTTVTYSLLSTSGGAETKHPWLGDILMPHNVGNISVLGDLEGDSCAIAVERRVQNYIDNHIYMEATLQPAYTAAAFLLFQDGVARDVLPGSAAASSTAVPLRLDQNVQMMSVWLSIPRSNVIQTLLGCVLLIGGLAAAVVRSRLTAATQPLRDYITAPHDIARVMVDDATFPSVLLERQFTHKTVEGDASEFVIEALAVRQATPKEKEEEEDGRRSVEV